MKPDELLRNLLHGRWEIIDKNMICASDGFSVTGTLIHATNHKLFNFDFYNEGTLEYGNNKNNIYVLKLIEKN